MKIIARCLLLALLIFAVSGCGHKPEAARQVLLSSSLDRTLVQTLLEAYNSGSPQKIGLVEGLTAGTRADLYLEPQRVLRQKQQELKPWQYVPKKQLPENLVEKKQFWYGVFYDPVVLLVKHQYARNLGQDKLTTWSDLPQAASCRITMENLTDRDSTREFLAGMASHMGEIEAIQYFRNLKPRITSYGKTPFNSIRMVTVGDADIAVTRRSDVMKYLESDFPAYILQPLEGSPATLYGLALDKAGAQDKAAADFLEWLLTSPEARKILRLQQNGFLPVLDEKGEPADSSKIWLNTSYEDVQALDRLANVWLKEIRF